MDTLQIGKLAVRCHLSSASESDRERLARLFHGPIGEALEGALSGSGLDPRAEICIRRLVVPTRLWLGLTDAALLSAWAAAAIEHLRQALAAEQSDEVVRYNSIVDAVIDAIRGSVRGRTARRWAWTQLGLHSHDEPAATVAALFIAHPDAIVPAFRTLVADAAFRAVVERLADPTFASIVDAALCHGGRAITVEAVASRAAQRPQRVEDGASTDQQTRAHAAGQRSSVSGLGRMTQSPVRSCALALLALLDAEPALLAGSLDEVAHVAALIARALTEDSFNSKAGAADAGQPSRWSDPPAPAGAPRPRSRTTSKTSVTPPQPDAGSPASEVNRPAQNGRADRDSRAERRDGRERDVDLVPDSAADDDMPLDLRRRAFTDWAGLLFLVHAARDIDLARLILDDPALRDRPVAWVLQQLAMALVPAPSDDAAVRAFAGLPPAHGDEPLLDEPRGDEPPAVLALAPLVVAATCARLDRSVEDEVLYEVCARRGEIVADPGWIEVRVSLDHVSTDVRRAGLDLDPDHIDWLGLVMKIKYV